MRHAVPWNTVWTLSEYSKKKKPDWCRIMVQVSFINFLHWSPAVNNVFITQSDCLTEIAAKMLLDPSHSVTCKNLQDCSYHIEKDQSENVSVYTLSLALDNEGITWSDCPVTKQYTVVHPTKTDWYCFFFNRNFYIYSLLTFQFVLLTYNSTIKYCKRSEKEWS